MISTKDSKTVSAVHLEHLSHEVASEVESLIDNYKPEWEAKLFSRLDMASGFYPIPVHPESIERTAFVSPEGQYEFLAMTFGLKSGQSVLQRAIIKALGSVAYTFVIVHIDDVLIVAETKEQAMERLDQVLQILMEAGFSLSISKCTF